MKETKILVVFTGGTIGSVPEEGFLIPGGSASRRLLLEKFLKEKQAFYEERFQTRIIFEWVCPYEILSENLNGKHLEMLWNTVKDARAFDGIIITTGTDTLAYSSAAMGYLFAESAIPIVTVSANYSLTDERSNGFANFEGAVLLILEGKHKGVFCSYKNKKEHFIHYATRLLPQNNYSDQVFSVKDGVYGKAENGKQGLECVKAAEVSSKALWENGNCVPKALTEMTCSKLQNIRICFQRPYPGMVFEIPDGCDAILMDTYHSGTLPVDCGGFESFVSEALRRKIPIFIAGVPKGLAYETVRSYEKEGIHVLSQASPAAMYVKLWLMKANGLDAGKYMNVSLGNDIVID